MKKHLVLPLLILALLLAPASFAHAQRYHYDVDQGDVRTRDGDVRTRDGGVGDRYDDEQDAYWRYRERYRPGDRESERLPDDRRRTDDRYRLDDRYRSDDRYVDPYYADAYPYTGVYPFFLEFSANDAALELAFGHVWEESARNFRTTFGGSVLYSDDEYQFFNLFFLLGNRTLFDRFRLDIGFKGVFGTVENDDDIEGDVSAVGFSVGAAYDFPEIEAFYGLPLDFEMATSFTVAPDPLCFQDLDNYREFRITGGIYVLEQKKGLVFIGYRAIDTSFDDGDDEWNELDDAFVFGYRFIF